MQEKRRCERFPQEWSVVALTEPASQCFFVQHPDLLATEKNAHTDLSGTPQAKRN
jgi:hypothetical protein